MNSEPLYLLSCPLYSPIIWFQGISHIFTTIAVFCREQPYFLSPYFPTFVSTCSLRPFNDGAGTPCFCADKYSCAHIPGRALLCR
ncbi:hypothetical protein Y032_0001g423 [Ancylostoma ceylanicum]|uniref:Uncharacterized protein n=1 Tax=Ancylostoma ceylanicum TaxID=53326 RepID=A0A016W588_9BILA|nr:hypothetical protein Y032_0001g423 [Ancylostoma ceylanicum]